VNEHPLLQSLSAAIDATFEAVDPQKLLLVGKVPLTYGTLRDRMARLLKYRGPFDDSEWTSYHADGKKILTAYANGINAYITSHADRLPVEFVLTEPTFEPLR
jgi:hypothetical protein